MTVTVKPRNNNSAKKSSFTLNFFVNTRGVTQKLRSWNVFFNGNMLFIVRLNVYM